MSSKWRKHVTQAERPGPPADGQQIVQALGSRGSNLIEVGHHMYMAAKHRAYEMSAALGGMKAVNAQARRSAYLEAGSL